MIRRNLLRDTFTLVRAADGTAVDAEGNTVRAVAAGATVRGLLQQVSVEESDETLQLQGSVWRLFLPAGTQIGPDDQVVAGDLRLRVDGLPDYAASPRAGSHVEVRLVRDALSQ